MLIKTTDNGYSGKSIHTLKANERSKLWYETHKHLPEFTASRKKRLWIWRNKYPSKYLWQGARNRARSLNLPFDIEPSDIFIPSECPVLKVPFKFGTKYAMSLDRKISSLGYTKGNVQVISLKANLMKQDASIEELRNFAEWISLLKI